MRIGIDLGGTKIEGLALGEQGEELMRHRIDTPRDYALSLAAVASVVAHLEQGTGLTGTVGLGMPGTISTRTGTVKNANSTWLNGKHFQRDLSDTLQREVRVANDANCLAVSEATDGAAAGKEVVFAVILGTGTGGGISIHGKVHAGRNGLGGEWGHNPLPWPRATELPGPACYCGKHGCLETWVSGTGVANDFNRTTPSADGVLTTREIVGCAEAGHADAQAALDRFEDRLARGLATVVNLFDPDVIVFGGGLSRIQRLYQNLPAKVLPYVFGSEFDTPLLPAKFGDSSGVRGAAWLWPLG